MTSGSMQTQCMFYSDSKCYFHAAFPTECRLCFNFSTPYKLSSKGKVKPVYSLFDYIRASGDRDLFFPKKDSFQKTL